MTLRIRQIVFAARDLAPTVAQFEQTFGLQVAYRDPLVAEFGLHNALLPIGDQFLEVVSPTRADTAAGRQLDRHGACAYMLILQTDDLARDRARLARLGVRLVWQANYPDIQAVHVHPKDIGAAIVSLDQPTPPASWRWAGPDWERHVSQRGAQRVLEVTVGALDPDAMAKRWAEVLGTPPPEQGRIALDSGALRFVAAPSERIVAYRLAWSAPLTTPRTHTICGTTFELV